MSRNREVIGVYLGTDFIFDNGPDRCTIIGKVRLPDRSTITVKGYAAEDQIAKGVTYRFFGRPRTHHQYGEQFWFSSFVEDTPVDEDSVVSYLVQCKNPDRGSLTNRVAMRLVDKYGVAAIDEIIKDPIGAAHGIARWDPGKAAIAANWLRANDRTRRAKLALIHLLDGRGFPKRTADRAIKKWGTDAASIILADPFELMYLPGIGFKGADKLYCDLAKETSATNEEFQEKLALVKRQGLCATYEISSDTSGSTWFPIGWAKAAVNRNVAGSHARPDEAIKWAVLNNRLRVRDGAWVALTRKALHEQEVAERLIGSARGHEWPTADAVARFAPEGKPLSDHQLAAIATALTGRICCLQGSPGVGKTFAVACIVKTLISRFGRDQIAACCPTGKASVRMTQAMRANGVDLIATTTHRMLQVEANEGGEDGWSFHYTEQNPLPYRFIIVDESSMKDVDIMASLLRACPPSTHVLFVGDSNQLAPVGHGRPFLDMQSIVPTGHLTEIRRNSGRIVRACATIRDERRFVPSPKLDIDAGENMPLIEVPEDVQVVALENIMRQLAASGECDPVWDVQILTALNDRGEVSRKPLNRLMQGILNCDGETVVGNPFRSGDKVVCLKNGEYQDAEDRTIQHFVANGELGQVTQLRPGLMTVRLDDPRRIIAIPHAPVQANEDGISDSEDEQQRGAVGDWDLGYVLSVHRSQGSQWKYVIVMIDGSGGARMVQSRNWIYTAISRAEIATFLIGPASVVGRMMSRDGVSDRKTFLVEQARREAAAVAVDHGALFAEV